MPLILIAQPTGAVHELLPMPFRLNELDRAVEHALDAGSSGACG